MKRCLTIFTLLSIYNFCKAQTTMNCCVPTATEKFAMLASDKSFVMSHAEPLPFTYHSAKGHDITYKTSDGNNAHAWEVKADKNTNYYLFVVHEWWGLNDYIKQESEKLSDELGVNVIALDLYDNKVAATREDAGKIMQSVKQDRALAIIHGAYNYVGSNVKVLTIGWCFGGGWSLQIAIEGLNALPPLCSLRLRLPLLLIRRAEEVVQSLFRGRAEFLADAGGFILVSLNRLQHSLLNRKNVPAAFRDVLLNQIV